MTTYPDTMFRPVAESLLACLCAEVTLNPDPPAICGFRPWLNGSPLGALNTDECCQGLAALYVNPAFGSDSANVPATKPIRCRVGWTLTMQMVLWRCAPTGGIREVPAQSEWTANYNKLFDDMASLRGAACCFMDKRQQGTVTFQDIIVIGDGPEGGCIGTSLTLTAGIY